MSNKSILQTNNEALSSNNLDLQALIDQANALPDVINIDEELNTQDDLIAQIQAAVDELPEAGSRENSSIEKATISFNASYGTVIRYIDESNTLTTLSNPNAPFSNMPVPRIYIAINDNGLNSSQPSSGKCELIYSSYNVAIYYITGDCWLSVPGFHDDGAMN